MQIYTEFRINKNKYTFFRIYKLFIMIMNNIELKESRKKLKLTQTELANLIGRTTMRTVQNWESGINKIPDYVADLINKKLKELNTPNFVFKNPNTKEDAIIKNNSKGVPYYDVDFAGGWSSGELFTTQKPSFFITSPDFHDANFACNLSGPSISNSIPSGAILGFKEVQDWKTYFPGGEFYGVVTKNNLRTVKIAKRIKGNDKELLLIPDPLPIHKDRYDEETVPIDFIIGFYQVVAWAQFERLVM
jgi:transcriptional regulator with XRE-family HTH domain